MSSSEFKRKIEELDSMSELNDDEGDLTNDSSLSSVSSSIVNKSTKKSTSGLVTVSSKSNNTNEYSTRISKIIETHFDEEINYKKYELDKICDRIFEAQNMLDKLRVCVICNYYSLNGKLNLNEYMNHPAISNLKCEHLEMAIQQGLSEKIHMVNEVLRAKQQTHRSSSTDDSTQLTLGQHVHRHREEESHMNHMQQIERQIIMENYQQFNIKLFVGNVSKSLNTSMSNASSRTEQILLLNEQGETVIESSQYNQELITHKWMIYIRSPNCAKLSNYIRKVIFYLHFSYKPYDVVEVRNAPFQLIRRGWGEFPVHVQIHFKDARNKRVDINHQLKLDWTQTGLQTFGGETAQDVCLYIKRNDFISTSQQTSSSTASTSATAVNDEPKQDAINERLDEMEQEKFDYYNPSQQQIDQQQEQQPQPLQEEYTFIAQSQRLNEVEYGMGEINLINAVFDSDSSSSFGASSLLLTKNSMQTNSTNEFGGRLSPSNFISTDVDLMIAKNDKHSQHDDQRQQQEQQHQTRQEQSQTHTSSIGFDELMRNICSNSPSPAVTQTTTNMVIESPVVRLTNSSDESKNNPATSRIEASKSKANLDDLLNLRPKSLSSFQQINKLPLTLIKSVLPIKTVSHTTSIATSSLPIASNASNHMQQLDKSHESRENYLDNKKVVIYKVDSTDLNTKTSSSILNFSTNNHTNIINSSSFNHNTDCVISDVRQSTLPITQLSNNNEAHATLLNTKKIKLTSDQLTKIKRVEQKSQTDKSHEQQQQQPAQAVLAHSNQAESTIKDEHLMMREAMANEEPMELKEISLENKQMNEEDKQVYTVERLLQQLKVANDQTQSKLFNFEYFLHIAQKYCPIVCNNKPIGECRKAARSVNYLFAANSVHEFYAWPYAKRKANEWLRALYIKRKCKQLISFHMSTRSHVNLIEPWSTKSIVLWLRSHGFTPLEYKHMFDNEYLYKQPELHRYVNSFSSINELVKLDKDTLKNQPDSSSSSSSSIPKRRTHEEDDDVYVDVVNSYEERTKPKNYLVKQDLREEQHGEMSEVGSIEMCLGSKYVREQLDLLDLKTKPVYVMPSMETEENEENLFSCHLVERFLFAICKRFGEDLIRETCSNIYQNKNLHTHRQNKSSSKPNEQSKKPTNQRSNEQSSKKDAQSECTLVAQKFPLYLGVCDIYKTIVNNDKYDFLTNKYMSLDRPARERIEK